MEVVILGCGTSSSVPSMRCLFGKGCDICREAQANPDSKNRRLNPSLLIRNLQTSTNVLIDCGKTFREVSLRIFPKIDVSVVHSGEPKASSKKSCHGTAKFRVEVFDPWEPFTAGGMEFLPIPVTHGVGYTSFGFEFGHEFGTRFVYISDVSEFPDVTKAYLNDASKPPIDIMMIDALYLDKRNSAHMNLMEVVKEIETIRPKRTLLTGMNHELDYFTYGNLVKELGIEKGLHIEMPYDGMRLPFP